MAGMAAWTNDSTSTTVPTAVSTTSGTVIYFFDRTTSSSNVEFVEEIKKPRYRPPLPVERELAPPKQLKARHGFQQMCRIPCYRGVRTR